MSVVIFECDSKTIADYLVSKGCEIVDIEVRNGRSVYLFEHDDLLDETIDAWIDNFKNSMY